MYFYIWTPQIWYYLILSLTKFTNYSIEQHNMPFKLQSVLSIILWKQVLKKLDKSKQYDCWGLHNQIKHEVQVPVSKSPIVAGAGILHNFLKKRLGMHAVSWTAVRLFNSTSNSYYLKNLWIVFFLILFPCNMKYEESSHRNQIHYSYGWKYYLDIYNSSFYLCTRLTNSLIFFF